MKIEHGKTYLNGHGNKCHITKRPEGHQTVWSFQDQHGDTYDDVGMSSYPYRDDDLVSEYIVDIPRPDGVKMTLADVEVALKERSGGREFCFSWVTVEALVNKIKQLEGLSCSTN